MKQATIYDYVRMCRAATTRCSKCPLNSSNNGAGIICSTFVKQCPDKANEIILKWCEEHPVVTRQDRLLKMFPKTKTCNGVIDICPISFGGECSIGDNCSECEKEYWLAEVEENE